MAKRTNTPMSQSPLVALAEQAGEIEAAHGVLLVRAADGGKAMYPMDGSDPDVLAGLLSWGIAMIFAAEEIVDEDDED